MNLKNDRRTEKPVEPDFKEGTKFDSEKAPIALISSEAIEEEAKVMGYGEKKYGTWNWAVGISWIRVSSAVLRHIFAWLRGEDLDPETRLHHLAHARCGLAFLLWYSKHRKEFDDRFKP